MSNKILILILISILTYSCQWDSRKDYKYVGYNRSLKIKSDTIIFKTINDTLAYIKAFELYCDSESDRFNLYNENGLEISKTIKFVTKTKLRKNSNKMQKNEKRLMKLQKN